MTSYSGSISGLHIQDRSCACPTHGSRKRDHRRVIRTSTNQQTWNRVARRSVPNSMYALTCRTVVYTLVRMSRRQRRYPEMVCGLLLLPCKWSQSCVWSGGREEDLDLYWPLRVLYNGPHRSGTMSPLHHTPEASTYGNLRTCNRNTSSCTYISWVRFCKKLRLPVTSCP